MAVDKFFYFTFITGVLLWQSHCVYWICSAAKTRFLLGRNLGSVTNEESIRSHNRLTGHLKQLIEGSDTKKLFPTVKTYYIVTGLLFLMGAVLLYVMTGWQSAIFWGCIIAMLPYCLMQVRLHERRVERSKEGDILIQELLNNYQILNYNMQEAIECTAENMEGAPLGKQLYLQLAKGLRQAVTHKEVETLLSSFRYAFDTAWGNVLASNIVFAHLYGIKVDAALTDLLNCMTESRKSMEFGRRENHEARLMLIYLAPISFFLSIFFACRYFDFTVKQFFSYQFGTELGLKWFLAMATCYIFSLIIQGFLVKEKMDI